MAQRQDTVMIRGVPFPGRTIVFGQGDTGWYYRDRADRISGEIIHTFLYKGDEYFVISAQDGQMDVRPEYLVAHKPDAPIGFASDDDATGADLADIVMPRVPE